ncbi:unnamed protein product [Lymnaea stagnalis]|uniref:Cornifelin n=1 Tax=Lymnaea stagnalis TaxID=6523 RepID=A0AAV2H3I2_LYMST
MSHEQWKPDTSTSATAPDCEDPAPPYTLSQQMPCSTQHPLFNQPAPPYSSPQLGSPYTHYTTYQAPSYYPMPPPAPTSSSTTVIIQQPTSIMGPNGRRLWSSKVSDCCQDQNICCCGTFCYGCLACQVSTDMGESFCVPFCVSGWLTTLRTKMRTEQNIAGSVLDDCCAVCFCAPCVLCQLAREIKLCRSSGHMRI